MAMASAIMPPAPRPWKARKAINSPMFWARPHRAEATVKSASASKKMRLVPQRSPNQPEAGMTTARLTR